MSKATLSPSLEASLPPRTAFGVARPKGARTRLCVIGFPPSPNTGRAVLVSEAIAAALPDTYETWHYFAFPPTHYQLAEYIKQNE